MNHKKPNFLYLSIAIILFSGVGLRAQERPIYEIQAAIILNMVKFTQWSNEGDGKDSFVMGVFGDDKLFSTLNTASKTKLKGTKKIVVNNLQGVDEIQNCDLIFLGDDKLGEFQKAKEITTNKPILCVTGTESYCKKGSAVNLVSVNNKMVIEINESVIAKNGFKISSTLLSMAKIIK
jgi:YfiR/HmsC-like